MVYRLSVTVLAIALALVFAVNCSSNKKTVDAPPGGSGTDAAIDSPGNNMPDAPGGGSNAGVTCGSSTCTGGDVCCVGSGFTHTCVGSGSGMCMGATLSCDGTSDCSNGDVCCFTGGTAGGGFGTMCEAGSACRFQACNGSADCMGSASMCCPLGSGGLSACEARCL